MSGLVSYESSGSDSESPRDAKNKTDSKVSATEQLGHIKKKLKLRVEASEDLTDEDQAPLRRPDVSQKSLTELLPAPEKQGGRAPPSKMLSNIKPASVISLKPLSLTKQAAWLGESAKPVALRNLPKGSKPGAVSFFNLGTTLVIIFACLCFTEFPIEATLPKSLADSRSHIAPLTDPYPTEASAVDSGQCEESAGYADYGVSESHVSASGMPNLPKVDRLSIFRRVSSCLLST